MSVKNVTPDWRIYDFERFLALSWKLQNLQKLKEKNPINTANNMKCFRANLKQALTKKALSCFRAFNCVEARCGKSNLDFFNLLLFKG